MALEALPPPLAWNIEIEPVSREDHDNLDSEVEVSGRILNLSIKTVLSAIGAGHLPGVRARLLASAQTRGCSVEEILSGRRFCDGKLNCQNDFSECLCGQILHECGAGTNVFGFLTETYKAYGVSFGLNWSTFGGLLHSPLNLMDYIRRHWESKNGRPIKVESKLIRAPVTAEVEEDFEEIVRPARTERVETTTPHDCNLHGSECVYRPQFIPEPATRTAGPHGSLTLGAYTQESDDLDPGFTAGDFVEALQQTWTQVETRHHNSIRANGIWVAVYVGLLTTGRDKYRGSFQLRNWIQDSCMGRGDEWVAKILKQVCTNLRGQTLTRDDSSYPSPAGFPRSLYWWLCTGRGSGVRNNLTLSRTSRALPVTGDIVEATCENFNTLTETFVAEWETTHRVITPATYEDKEVTDKFGRTFTKRKEMLARRVSVRRDRHQGEINPDVSASIEGYVAKVFAAYSSWPTQLAPPVRLSGQATYGVSKAAGGLYGEVYKHIESIPKQYNKYWDAPHTSDPLIRRFQLSKNVGKEYWAADKASGVMERDGPFDPIPQTIKFRVLPDFEEAPKRKIWEDWEPICEVPLHNTQTSRYPALLRQLGPALKKFNSEKPARFVKGPPFAHEDFGRTVTHELTNSSVDILSHIVPGTTRHRVVAIPEFGLKARIITIPEGHLKLSGEYVRRHLWAAISERLPECQVFTKATEDSRIEEMLSSWVPETDPGSLEFISADLSKATDGFSHAAIRAVLRGLKKSGAPSWLVETAYENLGLGTPHMLEYPLEVLQSSRDPSFRRKIKEGLTSGRYGIVEREERENGKMIKVKYLTAAKLRGSLMGTPISFCILSLLNSWMSKDMGRRRLICGDDLLAVAHKETFFDYSRRAEQIGSRAHDLKTFRSKFGGVFCEAYVISKSRLEDLGLISEGSGNYWKLRPGSFKQFTKSYLGQFANSADLEFILGAGTKGLKHMLKETGGANGSVVANGLADREGVDEISWGRMERCFRVIFKHDRLRARKHGRHPNFPVELGGLGHPTWRGTLQCFSHQERVILRYGASIEPSPKNSLFKPLKTTLEVPLKYRKAYRDSQRVIGKAVDNFRLPRAMEARVKETGFEDNRFSLVPLRLCERLKALTLNKAHLGKGLKLIDRQSPSKTTLTHVKHKKILGALKLDPRFGSLRSRGPGASTSTLGPYVKITRMDQVIGELKAHDEEFGLFISNTFAANLRERRFTVQQDRSLLEYAAT
jgi:hypothetical protein